MNDNKLPQLFENKFECTGCSACYAICPQHAITMQEDEEGFLYPYIEEEKCVRCLQCVKRCPVKNLV